MRELLVVVLIVAVFVAVTWKPTTPESCRAMCAPRQVAALSLLECRCSERTPDLDGGAQ